MLSNGLQQYILHGQEETNIEYKESMSWGDNKTRLKIIRGILALANHANGGVIVVGVKERDGIFEPRGMTKSDYNSFSYDKVAAFVKNNSEPMARFKLIRDTMLIRNKSGNGIQEKRFCIIQVAESRELPVIASKTVLYDTSRPHYSSNICIRGGAVYIRPEATIESREILNQEEWRELLYRCMEKIKDRARKLVETDAIMSPQEKKPKRNDEAQFNRVLKKDRLI